MVLQTNLLHNIKHIHPGICLVFCIISMNMNKLNVVSSYLPWCTHSIEYNVLWLRGLLGRGLWVHEAPVWVGNPVGNPGPVSRDPWVPGREDAGGQLRGGIHKETAGGVGPQPGCLGHMCRCVGSRWGGQDRAGCPGQNVSVVPRVLALCVGRC